MANNVSCRAYSSFLVSQEPVYDSLITRDIRPNDSEWLGYFKTNPFEAYSGVEHTFDRIHQVQPDVTQPWKATPTGACVGSPCDPDENTIGWGWSRGTYNLVEQHWATKLICFEEVMTKTQARQHFSQIIDNILRPASVTINSDFIQRNVFELSAKKICVSAGLPEFTATWDPGSYRFLNTTCDPTGRLTAPVLQDQAWDMMMLGAAKVGSDGFSNLHLRTDVDTLRYLTREDPDLKEAWRFQTFGGAAAEFYKYGFSAKVGDWMARAILFPMRFNKIADGRYQRVLPFENLSALEGLKKEPTQAYKRAQYQLSHGVNPGALIVKPFVAQALNPEMPFMIREYAGKWRFAMDNLGEDDCGRAIENYRRNKGKFWADFKLAIKDEHPEWLITWFHKRDRPCITIIPTCNEDPGYPAQNYNMDFDPCPIESEISLQAIANQLGEFGIAANTIKVNGIAITHGAVSSVDFATLVTDLQNAWAAATQDGTWTAGDAATHTLTLTNPTVESVVIPWLQVG